MWRWRYSKANAQCYENWYRKRTAATSLAVKFAETGYAPPKLAHWDIPTMARTGVVIVGGGVILGGIDAAMFADGPNAALTMIYASHPFYGLDTLLKAWPRIRARLPTAVLEVYYGWTPGMLRHIERVGAPALEFKARIDSGLQLPGVIAKGMVGQRELTEALSRSGFYLYPCEIAEISSISLMRAQVRAHACARVPV